MAAPRLLLAAAVALQVSWAVMGTADPPTQALEGPRRAPRSPPCPNGCPKEQGHGYQDYIKDDKLYLTPKSAAVNVIFHTRTKLGHRKDKEENVQHGELAQYKGSDSLMGFTVSGNIWYCHQQRGVESQCLPTTTTSTTSPSTSTITITTTTTSTSTTSITATTAPAAGSQGLHVFFLILSVASVLLRLLLVMKGGLTYRSTLTEVNNYITLATVQAPTFPLRRLHALKNAVVVDLWLRLCLCLLMVCACTCMYGLYLVCTSENDLFVALYIPGAVCLLLHGYFCVRKVNRVIRVVVEGQRRTRPATRRHHDEEESTGAEDSLWREGGCPGQVINAVLKVCLLLLVLCLCVLSYGLWHLLQRRQGEAGGEVEGEGAGED